MRKFALPGRNAAEATKETDRLSMKIYGCPSAQSLVDGRERPLSIGLEVFLAFHNCVVYPANDGTALPWHAQLLSVLRTLRVCANWCREAEDLDL